jgi:hypothetical protein
MEGVLAFRVGKVRFSEFWPQEGENWIMTQVCCTGTLLAKREFALEVNRWFAICTSTVSAESAVT